MFEAIGNFILGRKIVIINKKHKVPNIIKWEDKPYDPRKVKEEIQFLEKENRYNHSFRECDFVGFFFVELD